MLISARIPWRIYKLLRRHWPAAYQRLRFGTSNINTEEHWSAAWTRHGQSGFRATGEMPLVRSRLLEIIPAGSRVLDVGCGVGEMMVLLRDRLGCTCSGSDISPAGIAEVVRKGLEGRVGKLPNVPYPASSFDVVLSMETLEHVTDARASLAAMVGAVRPGGMILVTVPDGAVDDEDAHVHRFTEKKLRGLASGMKVAFVERLDTGDDYGPPCLLMMATRTI